jgi:hypothetical protein
MLISFLSTHNILKPVLSTLHLEFKMPIRFIANATMFSPKDMVWWFSNIPCEGGTVKLSYMSGSWSNGGNANSQAFFGNHRWMKAKDGTSLPSITSPDLDLMIKGQGYLDDFVKVFSWINVHLDEIKAKNYPYAFTEAHVLQNVKPTTSTADAAKLREAKFNDKPTVYKHFFGGGQTVAVGLQKMADEKIFGVDCVGFVSQYLISAGLIGEYPAIEINKYADVFRPIQSARDVTPLSIIMWGNYHIAIIHKVSSFDEDGNGFTAEVCQSSSGGPRHDTGIQFRKFGTVNGAASFMISGSIPVVGLVTIGSAKLLQYNGAGL